MLNVALLQMVASANDQQANLTKGEEFCRRASAMQADIALFPEMWNIGYSEFDPTQPQAQTEWQAQAINQQDGFVIHFRKLAQELKMAIAITYLEKWPGSPRNTVSLIDRHGEIVLTYAKVHTCDFDCKEAACTPGDNFFVADLDTAKGVVKVGAMICFDREFPESARILMLGGAEIILTPNSCDLEECRLAQFKARAFENMVGMLMTNYAAPKNNGHSIAFKADGALVVEMGDSEGIAMASFDLDELRAYREYEVWGNAFRKPHRYNLLTALTVEKPFVRLDANELPYEPTKR